MVFCVFYVCTFVITFILDQIATDECEQDVTPFLCLYGFPIFSCLEQRVVLPTKEECERITTTSCRVEFNLAVAFGFDHLLPDCNELPSGTDNSCMFMKFD